MRLHVKKDILIQDIYMVQNVFTTQDKTNMKVPTSCILIKTPSHLTNNMIQTMNKTR